MRSAIFREPIDPPGTYRLVFLNAGSFATLISAIGKDGSVKIQEMGCEIEQSDEEEFAEHETIRREREHELAPSEDLESDDEDAEKEKKSKKDDLTINFPKFI